MGVYFKGQIYSRQAVYLRLCANENNQDVNSLEEEGLGEGEGFTVLISVSVGLPTPTPGSGQSVSREGIWTGGKGLYRCVGGWGCQLCT